MRMRLVTPGERGTYFTSPFDLSGNLNFMSSQARDMDKKQVFGRLKKFTSSRLPEIIPTSSGRTEALRLLLLHILSPAPSLLADLVTNGIPQIANPLIWAQRSGSC
jgi:hypothetical protein